MMCSATSGERWRKLCISLAAITASAALIVAGCGGGGASDSPPAVTAPTTPLAWDQGTWDQVIWQ